MLAPPRCGHSADVVIDSSQTFQTIEGWGNGSGNLGGQFINTYRLLGPVVADPVNLQMIDYLADDFGLTGTRIWEIGPRSDGSGNDNGDCDLVDWTKFQPGPFADVDGKYMGHFRDRIIAGGSQPSFYSSPIYASGSSMPKTWVLNHPGERAQQIWTSALYWRDHYGVHVNYVVIANEPGNHNSYSAAILADDIKALGPRLAAAGLTTRIQFPETINPKDGWDKITKVQNDPDMWTYLGRLSYHRYGTADPYRSSMRDFGKAKGIPTAQTEMDPATINDLFADLILGGVSYWEASFSSGYTLVPSDGQTTYTPAGYYFPIRQVTHYVRPGAVRIGTTSNDPSLTVLAFSQKGAVTTLISNTRNSSDRKVNLSNLPPGVYGLSRVIVHGRLGTTSEPSFQELGIRTVGVSGTLTLDVSGLAIDTLYPYSGPNHPPTIMTWGSNPGRVVAPSTTATLFVTANDPELDPLTYHWSVTSQPAGASAVLVDSNAATAVVSGLSLPGPYIFNVDVRDGVNTSSKQVYLIAYDTNQPPLLGYTGFRMPVPYGYALDLPGDKPLHTSMALPTSSLTLSANVSDPENDTLRGKWSVVSQPAGASVNLTPTTYIYASFRSGVSGMMVLGDYTFQIAVSDSSHTVTKQVVCTITPVNSAPVISSISATLSSILLPASTTQLSAVISDPEGDLLRCWWVVKAAPTGAKPLFTRQGWSATGITGLTSPGSYTFTLRAFDDTHMTTRDVTVTVNAAPGAPSSATIQRTPS